MVVASKERLFAMRQRELVYGCYDYTKAPPLQLLKRPRPTLSHTSPSGSSPDLVHLLLDECASLVTDPLTRLESEGTKAENQRPPTPPTKKESGSGVPKSPSSVAAFKGDGESEPSVGTASGDSSLAGKSTKEPTDVDEPINSNPDLGDWRLQMFDWACMVVDGFHMDRCLVLATAFNMLDRFTALELKRPGSPPISREDYQLFAMTALYMAVKLLNSPQKMGLETMSVMARDFYTPQDIAATELEMLMALQWRTTPPTAICFCRELSRLMYPTVDGSTDFEQVFSTICDVTVSDPSFLAFSPSITAVAALLHAARLTGRSRGQRNTLKKQAMDLLDFGSVKNSADALAAAYKKMEQLYC